MIPGQTKQRLKGIMRTALAALFFIAVQAQAFEIWGYYPWWLQGQWKTVDVSPYAQMLYFEIPIKEDGTLDPESGWPGKWRDFRSHLQQSGVGLIPTFTLFNQAAFEALFANEAKRARLRDSLLFHLNSVSADGAQFDIEFFSKLSPQSVQGFKLFIKDFSRSMTDRGKKLSLFVMANDPAGLYDGELLNSFDFLVLQGYDSHWRTSRTSGSVAELGGNFADGWENVLQRYLDMGARREKILFSVPYFGYEWPTHDDSPGSETRGEGREISYAPLPRELVPAIVASATERVKNYGVKRDAPTGSPYYAFRTEGGWFQGWFEDGDSLSRKFEFVQQQHLAGIAVFPVGYDGGAFDPLLKKFRAPAN